MSRTTARRRMLATLTVIATISILFAPAKAAPVNRRSFLTPYWCDGVLFAEIPANAATVRRVGAVPPQFQLLGEASGTTVLFSWHLLCDLQIGDAYYSDLSFSGLSVELQSPPAVCPACPRGVYDLWQVSNSPAYHSLLSNAGLDSPLVAGTSVSFDYANGHAVLGKVRVPWPRSRYEVTAAIQAPTIPFFRGLDGCGGSAGDEGCVPTDHWYEGTHGTYLTANANCDLSIAGAQMNITAEPQSPLAVMLGTAELEVSGAFVRVGRAAGIGDLGERFAKGEVTRPQCAEPRPQ